MDKLKKNIYDENNGLHYTLVDDYYIPDLKLPEGNRRGSNRGVISPKSACMGRTYKR